VPEPKRRKVFISYSREDRMPVERLAELLKANGLEVWTDSEIPIGEDWQRAIETAIDEASVILLVMSPSSMASPWLQVEYGMALRSGAKIIPLVLGDAPRSGLPLYLRKHHAVEFDPANENRAVESIAQLVESGGE
jgi:hypothetical protein